MKKIAILVSSLSLVCLVALSYGKVLFAGGSCNQELVSSLPSQIHFTVAQSLQIPGESGGIDLTGNGGEVHCAFSIGPSDEDHSIAASSEYDGEWVQDPNGKNVQWESSSKSGAYGVLWCNGYDSTGKPITVGMLKAALAPQIQLDTSPSGCQN